MPAGASAHTRSCSRDRVHQQHSLICINELAFERAIMNSFERSLRSVSPRCTMIDPVAVWHAEHMRFAQLLDFLEREITAFHHGDRPDYELMRDAVHYLHHYA